MIQKFLKYFKTLINEFKGIFSSPIRYYPSKVHWIQSLILCFLFSLVLIVLHYLVLFNIIPELGKKAIFIGIYVNEPISMITYAFFHNDLEHLFSNIFLLFILGVPFFTYFGIKRGFLLLLIIIFFSALLEAIFAKITGIFLFLFLILTVESTSDLTVFLDMHASGVGLPSFLTGITIIYV